MSSFSGNHTHPNPLKRELLSGAHGTHDRLLRSMLRVAREVRGSGPDLDPVDGPRCLGGEGAVFTVAAGRGSNPDSIIYIGVKVLRGLGH